MEKTLNKAQLRAAVEKARYYKELYDLGVIDTNTKEEKFRELRMYLNIFENEITPPYNEEGERIEKKRTIYNVVK